VGELGVDFAQQQRNPGKHVIGISLVVLMHIIMIYALVTGLAQKIVAVAKHPLETKIIEEIKEKPPEEPPPPPPKLQVPPPPFIPPPEVQIQVPVTIAPTISTVTNVKPAAPTTVTRPPEPAKPHLRKGVAPVFKVDFNYPPKAIKDSVEGEVVAHAFVNKDGTVREVKIIKQDRAGYFEKEVVRTLMQWKFTPDESDYIVEVPFSFKLTD
jgi:protein TonB